ncbi:MAG: hypothetical protein CM15mP44_6090 [Candidatus Neomarinimicrobiota bacterium]|nr:MAG: hypothetical protein CM15mP44_6090 [Candidatus Neomarinimicrobiota bacterium]
MIKIIKRIIAGFWLLNGLFAQESIFWEIVDAGVNSEFIESYINRLIEVDKFEENSIQASFSVIVQMDVEENSIKLKKLKAKDYQMGQYISFDMEEVEKMDPLKLNLLMSREYKWKDVNRRDLSELEEFSTVDNVFKERSFKDARDAFWWSNSQISVSTSGRGFIRQKSGSLAFRLEKGFMDLGLSRELSENLLLGVSNDIVSTYLIVPGNTESVIKDIGHPLEGNLGFGFKFDTHKLGGQINYMDVDGQDYDQEKVYSRKHIMVPSSSGILYWSNTFQINRKVDSKYGEKIKDQKKEKAKAEKLISKSRKWNIDGEDYNAIFQSVEDNKVVLVIEKDEKAHKIAEKGKEWTTVSGSVVKAKLVERSKKSLKLKRLDDGREFPLDLKKLSDEDKAFVGRLKWDGEKTMTVSLDALSSEDQKIVSAATGVVRARKGKGRELKVVQPYGSMRLKAGLSFTQLLHGRVNENNELLVTDRVSGTNALGVYAKVEGVTDDKKSKAYLQLNVSDSGFKAYSLGVETNAYKMVSVGMDITLYPSNSSVDFKDNRDNPSSKWTWYPGFRPNEKGENAGTMIISPFISVNF